MTLSEHELQVRRSARYYMAGDAGPALRECWIACHGYGQLAGYFARAFEPLAGPGRCIVAPEALSRFYVGEDSRERVGASWMTKEDRLAEIADYVAYLDAVCDQVLRGRQVNLTAFGFSQGASTVSRWTALGRHAVQRLVLWGGELPPDLDLAAARERFAQLEVVVVRGTSDEYITTKVMKSIVGRLAEQGVRHRVIEFDGGHEINESILRTLG